MKKLIVFILIIALIGVLIVSCSDSKGDDSPISDALRFEKVDLSKNAERGASLYFLAKDSSRLVAEFRNIAFSETESNEAVLVKELLNGPEQTDLKSFGNDFSFDRIEIMNNVANVYLTSSSSSDFQKFALALAITDTLSDYSSVKYVNLFVNGKALYYDGYPVGTLVKNQNVIQDEISRHLSNASSRKITATLYFSDSTQQYILPEVREISIRSNDYVSAVIKELVKGPQEHYDYLPCVPSSLSCMHSEVADDGVKDISLNVIPVKSINTKDLSYAALEYSVSGIDSECSEARFFVTDRKKNFVLCTRDKYKSFAGSVMSIYTPLDDFTGLHQINITVPQYESNVPKYVLNEVLNSINIIDITEDYVDDIYVAKDTVVVDWNPKIKKKVSGMLSDSERLLIFSIVDSLTNMKDIKKVQFLIDGERVNEFAGSIDIVDPLLRNPGMII